MRRAAADGGPREPHLLVVDAHDRLAHRQSVYKRRDGEVSYSMSPQPPLSARQYTSLMRRSELSKISACSSMRPLLGQGELDDALLLDRVRARVAFRGRSAIAATGVADVERLA